MPAHVVPALWQEVEYQIPVHLKSEIDALIEPYLASGVAVKASAEVPPAIKVTITDDGYELVDTPKDLLLRIAFTTSGRPTIRKL